MKKVTIGSFEKEKFHPNRHLARYCIHPFNYCISLEVHMKIHYFVW